MSQVFRVTIQRHTPGNHRARVGVPQRLMRRETASRSPTRSMHDIALAEGYSPWTG